MGADQRLFDPQRPHFPSLRGPAWLPNEPDETLAHYAARMVDSLRAILADAGAREGEYYLGGTSFGGMLAQELARLVRPRALILMATCRHGDAIAPHLKYFVKYANLLPERSFQPGQGATPLFVAKFGKLTDEQREWFEALLADSLPAFVRWGIAAITDWPGRDIGDVPVHQIHGSDDQLIPAATCGTTRIVAGAGHLINVTHAAEVNTFIRQAMAGKA